MLPRGKTHGIARGFLPWEGYSHDNANSGRLTTYSKIDDIILYMYRRYTYLYIYTTIHTIKLLSIETAGKVAACGFAVLGPPVHTEGHQRVQSGCTQEGLAWGHSERPDNPVFHTFIK